MDAFYMILPSNVSTPGFFADNTISNYTTKLPQQIVMTGNWEVALMEVSFTYSYNNVPQDQQFEIWFYDVNSRKLNKLSLVLPRGLYNNIQVLCNTINKQIEAVVDKLPSNASAPVIYMRNNKPLIFNGRDQRGRLLLLIFDPFLAGMLGFDSEREYHFLRHYYFDVDLKNPRQPTSEEVYRYPNGNFDLRYGDTSLYFHCDIVTDSVLGNAYQPILRCVQTPLEAKWGDQVSVKYPQPLYIPISVSEFGAVTINVKNTAGNQVHFRRGRVCVTLHFRKKSI